MDSKYKNKLSKNLIQSNPYSKISPIKSKNINIQWPALDKRNGALFKGLSIKLKGPTPLNKAEKHILPQGQLNKPK